MTSSELRARLHGFEAEAERTAAVAAAAETAHTAAIRGAVETGDRGPIEKTAAALAKTHRDHDRATAMCEQASHLLAEQLRRERDSVREAARAEIEAELGEMAEDAHALDGKFAELVRRLVRLRERETALHRKAREHFRAPWTSPQTLSAARSMATHLNSLANGVQPDARPVIADTVASAAHSIRETFHAE